MNKITQEIKDKWLEALKSGNYTQTNGRLKKDNSHCCLGVLAEVLGQTITKEGNETLQQDTCDVYDELYYNIRLVQLIDANDDSYYNGVRDYSTVIPIIESIVIKN